MNHFWTIDVPYVTAALLGPWAITAFFVSRTARAVTYADRRAELVRRVRPRMNRLVWATVILSVGFGTWAAIGDHAGVTVAGSNGRPFVLAASAGFHLLFWPFACPTFQALQRIGRELQILPENTARPPRRAASLKSRTTSEYLPPSARAWPWIVGTVGLAWIAVRVTQLLSDSREIASTMPFLSAGFFSLGALTFLAGYGYWRNREILAPQDLVGSGPLAEEYEAEVESVRRFRVRCIGACQISAAIAFFVIAAVALEVSAGNPDGRTVGLVGGIGGSLVGILGAAFGVTASLKWNKLQMLRKRIEDESPRYADSLGGS